MKKDIMNKGKVKDCFALRKINKEKSITTFQFHILVEALDIRVVIFEVEFRWVKTNDEDICVSVESVGIRPSTIFPKVFPLDRGRNIWESSILCRYTKVSREEMNKFGSHGNLLDEIGDIARKIVCEDFGFEWK